MKVLLIVYDNESYIHLFPLGTAYLASVLRENGNSVTIYQQDANHWQPEHLTHYLDNSTFDMVGLGFIAGYWQYRQAAALSKAIAASKNRPKYFVLGGHGPSPEPEYFLRLTGADFVVIGEGENTLIDLIDNIDDPRFVRGIAYLDNDKLAVTGARLPIGTDPAGIKHIDDIPWPAYDMFPINYYRLLRLAYVKPTDFVMPMLSARGCTFRCNFCYRMDTGYRTRSPQAIIAEIRYLQSEYGITYIDFADELLMSGKSRIAALCDAFLSAGLNFRWFCNGRLNYAAKPIVQLMKRAGCVFINYGIEAFDDAVLENMNKHLTCDQIVSGIEATLTAGISPGFNIIWGNIGDNEHTLMKGVRFLLRYDDGAQLRTIRPVTPYPGSDLYQEAVSRGLLADAADFYERKHTNSDLMSVNFTGIDDGYCYNLLYTANKMLLENYYAHKKEDAIEAARNLYIHNDTTFRGFRQS